MLIKALNQYSKNEEIVIYEQILIPNDIVSHLPLSLKEKLTAKEIEQIKGAFVSTVRGYKLRYETTYLDRMIF